MARIVHVFENSDVRAVLFLAIWPFVYFWQVTLGQGVWFGTDTVRLFHPFGVELARALSDGRLPLWTTGIGAGFPLLAESQVGALYPVNLILYRWLPAHFALSYSVLLHLEWAGCGMYACARSFGLRPASALLVGFPFAFSGFFLAQIIHPPIVVTGAWLPWLIFLQNRFQHAMFVGAALRGCPGWATTQGRPYDATNIWFFLLCLVLGIQFLCGSMQIAFLNLLTCALFGFFGGLLWHGQPFGWRTVLRVALWTGLPLIVGIGIAAAQLLPTSELVGYSVRGGAPSESFVTSYSLPPSFLGQFISPFAQGEPSEQNNEYWGYFGIAPFGLAVITLLLRRDCRTIFIAAFALGALSLALGELNPVYQLLYRLPGFSFFRVPARYLLLVVFAATLLSAMAFEELSARLAAASIRKTLPWVIAFVVLIVGALGLARTQPLEFWLWVWQILPRLFIVFFCIMLWLAWKREMDRPAFQAIVVGVAIFDLACFAPPFITIDWIFPPDYVTTVPRSIPVLEGGRVFTDRERLLSMPALRGSLFNNTALAFGKESAQVWSSLALGRYEAFVADPSPAMLNLLNVRYLTVPLEPRPETKPCTPTDALTLDIVNNEVVIAPTIATAVQVVSFTERAENQPEATPIGEVVVRLSDGRVETFPLRLGIETADWDYDRKNVPHSRAHIARSFPAFWRAFGRSFEGHTYTARFALGGEREAIGVNVHAFFPYARLTVEGVSLLDAQDRATSLARLSGKNDFTLAYMSDTVAVWRNENVLPRAFIVHTAEVMNDDSAFARLRDPTFRADRIVLLSAGDALQELTVPESAQDAVEITQYKPERVGLSVTTDRRGYLLLADSWYPGWNAFVDGKPASIYRADVLFRAVSIEPGQHRVVFEYRPMSFVWGVAISAASLLIAAGILLIRKSPVPNLQSPTST